MAQAEVAASELGDDNAENLLEATLIISKKSSIYGVLHCIDMELHLVF